MGSSVLGNQGRLRRIFSLPSFSLLHSSVFIWGDLESICNSLHLFTLTRVAKPDIPLTYDIILHRNSLETVKKLLWIWRKKQHYCYRLNPSLAKVCSEEVPFISF